jgi:SPP1 family predicted phage head-tail adaptor
MQPGRLDRLVELRHRVLTRDPNSGEQLETWPAAYAEVWAEKKDLRGREFFAARTVNSELTTTWKIRHRTDVLMTDRLVYDGLVYTINSIAEIGRREGLELQAMAAPA